MSSEQLLLDIVEDGIAVATFNNESRLNSLSRELVETLVQTCKQVDSDPNVQVLILTGKGRSFCVGADIRLMSELETQIDGCNFIEWIARTCIKIETMNTPVIAAVNGYALGGGAEICLAADIVIASERAIFAFPEATIGSVPGFGILRLAECVGRQKAKELMMTGSRLSAEEAKELRLASQVVPHEELLKTAIALAHRIRASSQGALRLIKRGVNRKSGGEELSYWINTVGPLLVSDDSREGLLAFLEKREPLFGKDQE